MENKKTIKDIITRSIESSPLRGEAKEGVIVKSSEFGRSMVEMLGVLAIVGVLSAGALKGYSAAMFRHKTNQTIDIFNGILQRLIELDQQELDEDFEIYEADEIIQYNILPNCQKTPGVAGFGDYGCQLPLGTFEMGYGYNASKGRSVGNIVVSFTDAKSCIAFSSAGWEHAIPVEWWKNASSISISGATGATIYRPNGDSPITQVNMSDIVSACNASCVDGGCVWNLYRN